MFKVHNLAKCWHMYIPGTHTTIKITNIHHPINVLGGAFSGGFPFEASHLQSAEDLPRGRQFPIWPRGGLRLSKLSHQECTRSHEDSLGSSMFQVGGCRKQAYTVTVSMVINDHFATNVNNSVSIAALLSGTVTAQSQFSQKSTCSHVEWEARGRVQGGLDEM